MILVFRKASNQQDQIIRSFNKVRTQIESMAEKVYIRYTMDISNESYATEWDFIDETTPDHEGTLSRYYMCISILEKGSWE